jgi:hypothetical protein
MDSAEEFSFIVSQLEWLEQHLRNGGTHGLPPDRLEGALNALACARAVMAELAQIGSAGHDVPASALPQAA